MITGEILRVALAAVMANKLRSALTMLGIIIGIAAVITMVALGAGAQAQVQASIQNMGTNVLTVQPGSQYQGGVDRGTFARLTVDAARALLENPVYIRAVAPEMETRMQVKLGNTNANLQVLGTWNSYFDIHGHKLLAGRIYSQMEDEGRRRVAVLGARVGERLGTPYTPALIGETIYLRGVPFEVIGVLDEKGQQGFTNPDETIYIPIGTAEYRVVGNSRVRSIYVQAVSEQAMTAAIAEIDRVLRREQKLRPGQPSNFQVRDAAALISTLEETTRTFTYLLAGIAFVSLVVGGIGIMNIMLVSVTERTREIGVRKALGARRRDIMLQFLIEAMVLCMAGGIIGLATGAGGAKIIQNVAGWNTAVSINAALIALGFSAGVGLFFGIWPARRAAGLDPIVALRYE